MSNSAFLAKLGHALATQDNLATSDPVFCVFDTHVLHLPYMDEIISDPPAARLRSPTDVVYRQVVTSADHDCLIDGDEEAQYLKALEDDLHSFEYEAEDGEVEHGNVEDYARETRVWVPRFRVACLTQQAADDYIECNGHNLRHPFVYVESGYRNQEWIDLRRFLVNSPNAQPAQKA